MTCNIRLACEECNEVACGLAAGKKKPQESEIQMRLLASTINSKKGREKANANRHGIGPCRCLALDDQEGR